MGSLELERDTDPFSSDSVLGASLQETRRRMARVKRSLIEFMAFLSFGTFHIDFSRYGYGCFLVQHSPGMTLETEMDVVLGPLMEGNTAIAKDQVLVRGPVEIHDIDIDAQNPAFGIFGDIKSTGYPANDIGAPNV